MRSTLRRVLLRGRVTGRWLWPSSDMSLMGLMHINERSHMALPTVVIVDNFEGAFSHFIHIFCSSSAEKNPLTRERNSSNWAVYTTRPVVLRHCVWKKKLNHNFLIWRQRITPRLTFAKGRWLLRWRCWCRAKGRWLRRCRCWCRAKGRWLRRCRCWCHCCHCFTPSKLWIFTELGLQVEMCWSGTFLQLV